MEISGISGYEMLKDRVRNRLTDDMSYEDAVKIFDDEYLNC